MYQLKLMDFQAHFYMQLGTLATLALASNFCEGKIPKPKGCKLAICKHKLGIDSASETSVKGVRGCLGDRRATGMRGARC